MKNLLIYINPTKTFNGGTWGEEGDILAKIQIDNSLEMGWAREDILLVTNFYYKYNGVEALIIEDDNYCTFADGTPSKINAIVTLFEKGLIEDDLYWFHDFDNFQLEDIDIKLDSDKIALTDYGITNINKGRNGRWSTGSLFFKKDSKEVFDWIKEAVYKYQANEEVALLALTRHNKRNILDKIKKVNVTYNFATRRRDVAEQYKITDLPIKVIHFHPLDKRPVFYLKKTPHEGCNNMEVCVYGKNPMNKPLVTKRLIDVFERHGIK